MRDWLVKARKDSGMSQKAVCDAVGIAQPTYWEYEHDDCAPSPQIAIKLGSILGFDWTRFYVDTPKDIDEKVV